MKLIILFAEKNQPHYKKFADGFLWQWHVWGISLKKKSHSFGMAL